MFPEVKPRCSTLRVERKQNSLFPKGQDKRRQDNFISFLQNTLLTGLVLQVAKASRGGPGTIK